MPYATLHPMPGPTLAEGGHVSPALGIRDAVPGGRCRIVDARNAVGTAWITGTHG